MTANQISQQQDTGLNSITTKLKLLHNDKNQRIQTYLRNLNITAAIDSL